tara:strand:- start:186 stop:431 length:246 start_codon:yes stop_codon:yes gene_type:complete
MINTDKYEGHTPADAWRHADGSVNYMPPMNNKADVELITDAPLLLAEVERLRGLLREVADDYTDADGITYEIYCEFGGDEE